MGAIVGSFAPLLLIFSGAHIVTMLLVGLGQAHFVHCYLYQYQARKMDGDFFVKFVFGVAGASLGCLYLGDNVMIPAAIIFILHQFFDDLYLYKQTAAIYDYGQLFLVLIACFLLSTFETNTFTQQITTYALALAMLVGLVGKQRLIVYTLTLPFGLAAFYVMWDYQSGDWLIPVGIIIISHYLRWMIYIYQKHEKQTLWVFLSESLILNVLFVLYALATVLTVQNDYLSAALSGLFSIQAFVIWTMAHIASSMRPKFLGKKKVLTS